MQSQKADSSFTKQIGGVTYKVQVRFSENSKEHFNEKIIRIIKNDIAKNVKAS